ncbi:secreted protein [Algoriphagus ratkowskyi]|uniref:Ferritin-like domain-containing protein n=1 Tax=Algoriphagus ratkowskyi TaxID=57028 RepID=A0A2W7RFT9_9BACT|nr:ferritin-like domain-containing protein [Algoriphagus ratkowskyi]PZX59294.1 secreted protein [Algoriphagus ratkowskyi]TXD77436.1 ferritin-like domain-containing protein [Algoriphagus ratkowskyi]
MSKQTTSEDLVPMLGLQKVGDRRNFLKFSGAAIASTGILLSGCQEVFEELPNARKTGKGQEVRAVPLGKGDIGILNYAYALEQLEAAFYLMVVANMYAGISPSEKVMMEDIKNHEVAHRDFLKAALGKNAIIDLSFDFSSVNFNERSSVLATAKTFEDLGVAAYNGAGQLLESADYLLIAGKIVSVEARHAAAIRSILDADPRSFAGADVIDANGLDRAFSPTMVLEMAAPFITNKIIANQLPTS